MEFKKVKSSSLESVYYHHKEKQLDVLFKNDSLYRYDNVSLGEYEQILNSDSPGTKLKEIVKGKSYTKL